MDPNYWTTGERFLERVQTRIESATFKSGEYASCGVFEETFRKGGDSGSGRRIYDFTFPIADWPIGTYAGVLELATTDEKLHVHRLQLSILPSVSMIPERLTVDADKVYSIAIVDRVGANVFVSQYDANVISVKEVENQGQLSTLQVQQRPDVDIGSITTTIIVLEDQFGIVYQIPVKLNSGEATHGI